MCCVFRVCVRSSSSSSRTRASRNSMNELSSNSDAYSGLIVNLPYALRVTYRLISTYQLLLEGHAYEKISLTLACVLCVSCVSSRPIQALGLARRATA